MTNSTLQHLVAALLFFALAQLATPAEALFHSDLREFLQEHDIVSDDTSGLDAGREAAVTFELDGEQAQRGAAIVVEMDPKDPRPDLVLNGEPVVVEPIQNEMGLWYQLNPEQLEKGENLLEFGARGPVDGSVVFVMNGHFEQDHFGLFVNFAAPRAEPPVDPRQDMMDVQHCELDLTISSSSRAITGALTLTAESLDSSLDQCVLDLNDNGGSLSVTAVDQGPSTTPLSYTHNGSEERLYIDLPAAVPAGNTFTVRVFYSGTPVSVSGGGYLLGSHAGVPLVYTNSQPYYARTWWPCKDVPRDKFTMDMIITAPNTVYNGYPFFPVSNGMLVSNVDNGNGTNTIHWSETHNIATYLVSIAATNYRPASATYTALDTVTTMEMAHYVFPESYAAESAEINNTVQTMEFFAQTFGEYPFLNEKYYTATWGLSYGMEHQTCTSMPNLEHDSPFTRRSIHELAHMWFGDLITYETYDHLWLAEGWATYAEPLMYENLYGTAFYHNYINNWSTSDSRPLVSSNQDQFDSLTLNTAYRKGGWVLHMLRKVMGDTDFFQAVRNYVADASLRYNVADSADFQAHMEAVYGSNMDWFFDQWLYRTSRPSYEYAWTERQDGPDTVVDLFVNQVQSDTYYTMPIEVRIDFAGGGSQVATVYNDQQTQTFSINVGANDPVDVELDPDNWILANKQQVSGPSDPTLLSVITDQNAGTVDLSWTPVVAAGLQGYRIYQSPNGTSSWTLVADENTIGVGTTAHQLSGFSNGDEAYFVVAAVAGSEGERSDVYGVCFQPGSKVLVIDGYDRYAGQSFATGPSHNFAARHGVSIAAYGVAYDTVANETIGSTVTLNPTVYPVVVWSLGDESTADDTFSTAEQGLAGAYLDAGGALFANGNEIGWDLDWQGNGQSFYYNYLKAVFDDDDSEDYTVETHGNSTVFQPGDTFNFGSGDAPYTPGYPDAIFPLNGSVATLQYDASQVAGVEYFGTFGSATPGALVYLGFSFETISSQAERDLLMERILSALLPNADVHDAFMLY